MSRHLPFPPLHQSRPLPCQAHSSCYRRSPLCAVASKPLPDTTCGNRGLADSAHRPNPRKKGKLDEIVPLELVPLAFVYLCAFNPAHAANVPPVLNLHGLRCASPPSGWLCVGTLRVSRQKLENRKHLFIRATHAKRQRKWEAGAGHRVAVFTR